MTLPPPQPDAWCPPAFGGCRCACHHTPGMVHCVPCCVPTEPAYPDADEECIEPAAYDDPPCRTCGGTRTVNTFTLPPTAQGEHGDMENWPGPCPDCHPRGS